MSGGNSKRRNAPRRQPSARGHLTSAPAAVDRDAFASLDVDWPDGDPALSPWPSAREVEVIAHEVQEGRLAVRIRPARGAAADRSGPAGRSATVTDVCSGFGGTVVEVDLGEGAYVVLGHAELSLGGRYFEAGGHLAIGQGLWLDRRDDGTWTAVDDLRRRLAALAPIPGGGRPSFAGTVVGANGPFVAFELVEPDPQRDRLPLMVTHPVDRVPEDARSPGQPVAIRLRRAKDGSTSSDVAEVVRALTGPELAVREELLERELAVGTRHMSRVKVISAWGAIVELLAPDGSVLADARVDRYSIGGGVLVPHTFLARDARVEVDVARRSARGVDALMAGLATPPLLDQFRDAHGGLEVQAAADSPQNGMVRLRLPFDLTTRVPLRDLPADPSDGVAVELQSLERYSATGRDGKPYTAYRVKVRSLMAPEVLPGRHRASIVRVDASQLVLGINDVEFRVSWHDIGPIGELCPQQVFRSGQGVDAEVYRGERGLGAKVLLDAARDPEQQVGDLLGPPGAVLHGEVGQLRPDKNGNQFAIITLDQSRRFGGLLHHPDAAGLRRGDPVTVTRSEATIRQGRISISLKRTTGT